MRPSIANWKSGVAIAVLYVVALVLAMRRIGLLSIIAALLSCSGCVTAPNSNQSITINLLSSHSRYGQSQGGTNTTIKGQIEGGGALTATVPMSP